MQLSEKIIALRKSRNMTQEQLAEALNVSRQAVSRWEVGSALPDAMNVLQLSKLFGVSADYLLNDDYTSDRDIPAVKYTKAMAVRWTKSIFAIWTAAVGLIGNFIIYVLSRFFKVRVPAVVYENGRKFYRWSSDITDYSYKYFIADRNLELLTAVLWLLFLGGIAALCVLNWDKIKVGLLKLKEVVSKIKK